MRRDAAAAVFALAVASLWLVTVWPSRDPEVAGSFANEPPRFEAARVPPVFAPVATHELPGPAQSPALPPPAPATEATQPQIDPPESNPLIEQRGPVAERKLAYETEPRDSAASEVEGLIRSAFAHTEGSPNLLRSVLCRATVCKIELHWSPDRLDAYIAGVSRAAASFDGEVAIVPAAAMRPDRIRPVDVYLKRLPPAAN